MEVVIIKKCGYY